MIARHLQPLELGAQHGRQWFRGGAPRQGLEEIPPDQPFVRVVALQHGVHLREGGGQRRASCPAVACGSLGALVELEQALLTRRKPTRLGDARAGRRPTRVRPESGPAPSPSAASTAPARAVTTSPAASNSWRATATGACCPGRSRRASARSRAKSRPSAARARRWTRPSTLTPDAKTNRHRSVPWTRWVSTARSSRRSSARPSASLPGRIHRRPGPGSDSRAEGGSIPGPRSDQETIAFSRTRVEGPSKAIHVRPPAAGPPSARGPSSANTPCTQVPDENATLASSRLPSAWRSALAPYSHGERPRHAIEDVM